MKISVVFTTYNSTEWLEKVLWGLHFQSFRDFEVIIADDGSTSETAESIARMRDLTNLDITHVWQEDSGFRKCRILNKALLHVKNEYVVFTDGDCILRKDFLQVHHDRSDRGFYLSGSYFMLPMETSKTITSEDIEYQRCFDVDWLRENGLPQNKKILKINANPFWSRVLNKVTPTKCNLKGANASVWLNDLKAVNGFDERMAWGGLDRELGVRLINAGVKPRHVRYDAVCVHLDHARGYKDPEKVSSNKALRIMNQQSGVKTTEYGIQQLIEDGYRVGQ